MSVKIYTILHYIYTQYYYTQYILTKGFNCTIGISLNLSSSVNLFTLSLPAELINIKAGLISLYRRIFSISN